MAQLNRAAIAKDVDKYLIERVKKLEDCIMVALDYRPLPTDPFQEYVEMKCPDIIEKWRKMRNG